MMSVTERIRQSLLALHMARALETLDHTLGRLEKGEISAIEAIDDLLAEELNLREGRRIGVALRTARLMPIKTIESFDFSFQPSLDRHRITALAQLEFINRAEVLHFLGPPGTGKSHLATAIGVAAVRAGRSVYRCSLAELIEALTKAEREGRLAEKIRFYTRLLLIVDEIGYLPITPGGANLFFQLVNARYEKGAMILTSNRGFAEWGEVFGDPVVATALLDRLLHHAVVVQIEGQLSPAPACRSDPRARPGPRKPDAAARAKAPWQAAKTWSCRSSQWLITISALGNFAPALLGNLKQHLQDLVQSLQTGPNRPRRLRHNPARRQRRNKRPLPIRRDRIAPRLFMQIRRKPQQRITLHRRLPRNATRLVRRPGRTLSQCTTSRATPPPHVQPIKPPSHPPPQRRGMSRDSKPGYV
jgi:DNA replication protein DnaC